MRRTIKKFIELRGLEFVPIEFKIEGDLAKWKAEIPGKMKAFAFALFGV
ncbi:MAG TPA: hypothetical protein VNT20_22965 [Flavisolibacter sp.]|nr:hypothetical protein [Flavisolibacter sp.]